MLRKFAAILNILAVVVSATLFAYTFFAKGHLTEHARGFVTEKTLSFSQPIFGLAETGLDSPLSAKFLADEQKAAIRKEIDLYRAAPAKYVVALTANEAKSLGGGKAGAIKEKIRDYYQSTLRQLITDLRIFSGSNIVAGLLAFGLLLNKDFGRHPAVIAFSFIVFSAVAYSSFLYLDGMSFFKILFKWHLGWWYPIGIVITVFLWCRGYGRFVTGTVAAVDRPS